MAVRDNTKAGNSVKQTSPVLHIRGCVHLPLQQFFKIIISPDSTFYKLHSDIYFAKVLSQAMLVRTIFRKTLLKVYSTLKRPRLNDLTTLCLRCLTNYNDIRTVTYSGPWVSRHNQISHDTTKNSHGTTKYLTAQQNFVSPLFI